MPTERFARDVEYIPGRFSLRRVYDEMAKWTRFKQIQRKFGGAKSGDPSGCAVICSYRCAEAATAQGHILEAEINAHRTVDHRKYPNHLPRHLVG